MGRFLEWIYPWLLARVPFKEMGWREINEVFHRFTLFKCPWFSVYLHRLDAPIPHPKCHDHPWHFWALILSGGYWETINGKTHWRAPGTLLFRHAKSSHNVVTRGVNWSLILTSAKVRKWGYLECGSPT